jgi:hypothetical protein
MPMPNALLRTTLVLLIALMSGCATDRAGTVDGGPAQVSSPVHTIVLARGQQAVIADESLTVELVEINDSRCPAKVTCIWAGHAAVTLQVGKPGSPAQRVVIGTEAPDSMGLPGDADYDGHSFHLVELERGDAEGSTSDVPSQRATIKVTRLLQDR